jgi:hypothetical protein
VGLLSPVRAVPMDFRHGARDRETCGSGSPHPRAALSWLIERRSAAGVRRPTTVSFLLVAAALAPCHVVDCLAEAGVWPAARAKRDWMRPSVVRVSADLGDPPSLGNDFLPDAV